MMKRRTGIGDMRVCPVLLAGAAALTACHGTEGWKGRSSFEVLGSPPAALRAPAGVGNAVESDERIDPVPGYVTASAAQPIYPASALAAGAGERVVYATVTVDEFGHVTDVAPSWERIALRDRFTDEFFGAVKAAVSTWECVPARKVYYRRGPGGEDRYLRTEAVPMAFEVRFTFTGTGAVR